MKYLKFIMLLLTFTGILTTFSSCTPETMGKDDILQKEQFNNGTQATSDEDMEIDKSDRHGDD